MYNYGTGCGYNYGGYQVGYGYGNGNFQTTACSPQGYGGNCAIFLVLFILLALLGFCSDNC